MAIYKKGADPVALRAGSDLARVSLPENVYGFGWAEIRYLPHRHATPQLGHGGQLARVRRRARRRGGGLNRIQRYDIDLGDR